MFFLRPNSLEFILGSEVAPKNHLVALWAK
jgi:hypothetical protein